MIEWQPFGAKSLAFIDRPIEQDARITILEGSVRSSKTVSMIPKWLTYLNDGPKGLLVIVGVSKETIYDNVLRDLFETVGEGNYRYNRQSGELCLFGRDIKVIGAKDEGSEKYLRGKTLAGAYVDEGTLIPESFMKQLFNRLSIEGSKCYITTNPDTPSHYLLTEYIRDNDKIDSGMVSVIHFELDDNPNLSEEYKTFIRNAYAGVFYKRFILGMWVMAEGAVYDMWTDDNLYEDGYVTEWIWETARHYVTIDYGTHNPTAFLHVLDFTNPLTKRIELLIDDEYYYDSKKAGGQKTDKQYADDLEAFIEDIPNPIIIVDPSAASFIAELRQRGILVMDADNEVLDGIRLTGALIQRRILRVNKTHCPNIQREVGGYIWNMKKIDKGKEEPLKKNDHAMDAMRYFCKTIITIPRQLQMQIAA